MSLPRSPSPLLSLFLSLTSSDGKYGEASFQTDGQSSIFLSPKPQYIEALRNVDLRGSGTLEMEAGEGRGGRGGGGV